MTMPKGFDKNKEENIKSYDSYPKYLQPNTNASPPPFTPVRQAPPKYNNNYSNYQVPKQSSSGAAAGFFVILGMILAIVGNFYMWGGILMTC